MNIKPEQMGLIVNRAPDGKLSEGTREEVENRKLNLFGVVPSDELVYDYDCDGKAIVSLPEDSAIKVAIKEIAEKIGL